MKKYTILRQSGNDLTPIPVNQFNSIKLALKRLKKLKLIFKNTSFVLKFNK